MAITFNSERKNARGYAKGSIWIGSLNSAHAVTSWILLDRTGGLTVTPNGERTKFKDDTGATYFEDEVVNDYTIEANFLSSDEKVRTLFMPSGTNTVKGQTFAICFLDQEYLSSATTVQGYWVFYEASIFRTEGPWNVGGAEKGFKFMATAYANTSCASVTLTLPSGSDCFTPTATGATIGVGEFFLTADGATT